MMDGVYHYKSLQDSSREIRLLRSLPGSSRGWETSVHRLDQAPPYRAISYTWGEPESQHTILLDGCSFQVRKNCLTVLLQTDQHSDGNAYIWLDAICINQQDIDEKGAQVAMMGKVYAAASSVLASVGEEYDDSDLLYDIVIAAQAISEQQRASLDLCMLYRSTHYRNYPDDEQHNYWHWVSGLDDETYRRLVDAYNSFASRPYWRRLWVIQETGLTPRVDVACGRRIHKLEDMQCLCLFFRDVERNGSGYFENKPPGRCPIMPLPTDEDPLTNFGSCYAIRRSQANRTGITFSLGTFLPSLAATKCVDPRDRIYGLLSLLDWGIAGPPQPNYRIEPLVLALDVMTRVKSNDGRCKLQFPDNICRLLAALDVKATMPYSAFCSAESKDISTTEGSTASMVRPRPSGCACTSSTAPQPTLIELATAYQCCRLGHGKPRMIAYDPKRDEVQGYSFAPSSWYNIAKEHPDFEQSPDSVSEASSVSEGSTSCRDQESPSAQKNQARLANQDEDDGAPLWYCNLRRGDIMVRIETCWQGGWNSGPNGADFCLVLRNASDYYYYEVLDEVWTASWDFLGTAEPRHVPVDIRRTMGGGLFHLCLDVEDAASIAMVLNEQRSRAASERLPGDAGISFVSKTRRRRKLSSYAMLITSAMDEDVSDPTLVNGAPSVNGKQVPCADCGGVFTPRAEHVD